MTVTSGLSAFGIIRKRMADLYLDFATRIKDGGTFGVQTTVDTPDQYPGDPLVQIAAIHAASSSETWEAVESWYNQLDPETATGSYLDALHGSRVGVLRGPDQSDDAYREAILTVIRGRPTRSDPVAIAISRADVNCAVLVRSTTAAPIEDIPAPGAALVIRGCDVDYTALAEQFYQYVELGTYEFYGDITVGYAPDTGGCVSYNFMEARPLFAALQISGYVTEDCGTTDLATIKATAIAKLNAVYDGCGLGLFINAATVMLAIGTIPGFVVTGVKLARRAKQLWGNDCDATDAPKVTVCGAEVVWATSVTCGPGRGEVWCDPAQDCLPIRPWEYVAFDEQFITVIEDPSKGGCA